MRRPGRTRGISATILLVSATPLLIAAGTLLSVVVSHQSETEQVIGEQTADLIAFSGAQEGLAVVNQNVDFDGTLQVAINGGTAVVQVTQWDSDGVDNDQNGFIDDSAED